MDVTTTRPLLRGSVSYDDSFNVPPNFGKIGTGIGNLANAGGEFLKNIATLITNQQVRDALIQQAQQQIKHSLHQELNHPLYRQYNNNYDPALLGELAKVYTAGLLEGTGRLADSTTNTLFADLPNTFYGTNRYNDLRATTVEDFVKKLTGTTTQGHPFTAGIGDLAANLTVGDYVAGKLLNPVILNASERSIPFSHIVNQIPRRSAPQVEKSLPPVPQKRWDPVPGSYNNPYGGLYEAFRNFPTTAIGDSQGSVRQEWLFQAIEKLAQQMVPPPPFALPTGINDITPFPTAMKTVSPSYTELPHLRQGYSLESHPFLQLREITSQAKKLHAEFFGINQPAYILLNGEKSPPLAGNPVDLTFKTGKDRKKIIPTAVTMVDEDFAGNSIILTRFHLTEHILRKLEKHLKTIPKKERGRLIRNNRYSPFLKQIKATSVQSVESGKIQTEISRMLKNPQFLVWEEAKDKECMLYGRVLQGDLYFAVVNMQDKQIKTILHYTELYDDTKPERGLRKKYKPL